MTNTAKDFLKRVDENFVINNNGTGGLTISDRQQEVTAPDHMPQRKVTTKAEKRVVDRNCQTCTIYDCVNCNREGSINTDGKMTNIVYITTRCNLDCSYCYEKAKRDKEDFSHTDLTFDQINAYFTDILEREKGENSTLTIMGGEPSLRLDLVEYMVRMACGLVINGHKPEGFGMSVTTNGVMFLKQSAIDKITELMDLVDVANKKNGRAVLDLQLEISYDASGQDSRVYPNGKSSRAEVEKAMDNLNKAGVPFGISTTVTGKNIKNLIIDSIYMIERWKPTAISFSWAYMQLDQDLNINNSPSYVQQLEEELYPYLVEIYNKYKVPFCEIICNECGVCRPTEIGNAYLSPSQDILFGRKNTLGEFDQFQESKMANWNHSTEIFTIDVTTTNHCTLRCGYCFEEGYAGKPSKEDEDVIISKIRQFLPTLRQRYGLIRLNFWGGEPTLNMPFVERVINEFINEPDVIFAMVSNGYILPEKHKIILLAFQDVYLKGEPRFIQQISYDGRPIHDIYRKTVDGRLSAPNVLNTIDWLNNENIKYVLKSTITYDALSYMDQAFFDCLATQKNYTPGIYFPTIDTHTAATDDMFDEAGFRKAMDNIFEFEKKYGRPNQYAFSWFNPSRALCSAGCHMVALDIHGNVYTCHGLMYGDDIHLVQDIAGCRQVFEAVFRKEPVECKNCTVQFCLRCNATSLKNQKKQGI